MRLPQPPQLLAAVAASDDRFGGWGARGGGEEALGALEPGGGDRGYNLLYPT